MTNATSFPSPADVARVVLPNGIIVLARENFASQSVVITGSLRVGSIHEPAERTGLASFVTAALMRGTHNRDFDTLHGELEGIGASLGIGGGVHTSSFSGKSLAEDLPTLLDLLSDVLRYPAFPQDQTERLRGEMLTGLRIRLQDTRAVASDSFRNLTYPEGHPYRRDLNGTVESMSRLTLDEVREFHRSTFGPNAMIIVVVGAVKAEDAIAQVRRTFEGWQNPDQPAEIALPPIPAMTEIRQQFNVIPGKTQSDIVMGWTGPSRLSPDFHHANIANNILGVFGMMGRLGKTVREEQGLAYSAGSRVGGGFGPSPWSVSAGVNPANVRLALDSIVAQVKRMTDEMVSEDELEENKQNFIRRLPLSLESNEGVAGSILNMEIYHLGLDYLQRYADIINAITREDLLRAAQTYLKPDAYALGVAGPQIAGEE
ncbi:MAG: insulinase family protein [Anaerolineae bacterium]|nr:insulinase family protein [Anaerolineae bacterium]